MSVQGLYYEAQTEAVAGNERLTAPCFVNLAGTP